MLLRVTAECAGRRIVVILRRMAFGRSGAVSARCAVPGANRMDGAFMPIYEYECGKCGNRFEQLIRNAKTDVPTKCPKCGAAKLEKAFSAFAVSAAQPKHEPSAACSTCPSGGCPYSGRG